MTDTAWTPERIERLKQLWAKGVSADAIGTDLRISKNAVIGKVHRLGLQGRKTGLVKTDWAKRKRVIMEVQAMGGTMGTAARALGISETAVSKAATRFGIPFGPLAAQKWSTGGQKPKSAPQDRKSIKGVHQAPQAPKAPIALSAVPATATTLRGIMDSQCHHPIGDPKGLDTLYCGAEAVRRSLCEYHYHMDWRRVPSRSTSKLWRVA